MTYSFYITNFKLYSSSIVYGKNYHFLKKDPFYLFSCAVHTYFFFFELTGLGT